LEHRELDVGMAHLRAGRWEEGIAALRAVLAREPGLAEIWSNLGFALRAAGRGEEAREALERAVAISPRLADAWNLLGLVEQEAGRHDASRRHFDQAVVLRPGFALAMMNRANADQALGRHDAALAGYARALELDPSNAGIHYNLGVLHQKVAGRADAAIAEYREAIRLDPSFADAHLNLSDLLLAQGRLREGWDEFMWRPQRRAYAAERARAGAPYVLAPAGAPPLVLRAEQGLGDILFYLRHAAVAASRGVRLAFNGDRRLHPLLERTGLFEGIADEVAVSPSEILVGDLPLVVEAADESRPAPLRLGAEGAARERIARRLRAAGPPPWIALTWRAGERGVGLFDRHFKEISPAALGEALHGTTATWISVQRSPAAGEREALEARLGAPVHDFSGVNADLEEALATMSLVDDYIAVSNTNLHLRAGAGRAARVLVAFPPEWRWGFEGESPWFAGMRTYRAAPGSDWTQALAALRRDMRP
jgi:tetratricopeptide (TPR) repeat protein